MTPTFSEALRFWCKLGLISFGGPAGQIAIMHDELVDKRGWVSESRFQHALSYCLLLPGPEAQQLATYLGWLMHGWRGAVVAGTLFVLPALLLMLALAWLYMRFGHLPWVMAVFWGLKPVVVALVLQAAVRMGKRSLPTWRHVVLAMAALLAIVWWQLSFPLVLLMAAVAAYWLLPSQPAVSSARHEPAERGVLWRRSLLLALALMVLWFMPVLLAFMVWGSGSTLASMGIFFSQAAVLTFGGAYAVLPFVFDAAVNQYGWVSTAQVMDALALGETTPGPLVLVLSFVGFVGAYSQGVEIAWLAGLLVAWVTFVPSFLFILVGGPWIERSYGTQAWQRPLQGISTAVVAFIALLALQFAAHVVWPQGFSASMDTPALLLAVLAAWLFLRRQWSVPTVMLVGMLAGLAQYSLLH